MASLRRRFSFGSIVCGAALDDRGRRCYARQIFRGLQAVSAGRTLRHGAAVYRWRPRRAEQFARREVVPFGVMMASTEGRTAIQPQTGNRGMACQGAPNGRANGTVAAADDVGSAAKAHFVFVPLMYQGHRRIEVTRAQAPGFFRAPGFEKLADEVELALAESDGVVMNSFLEMEPEYVAGYAAARNMKLWTIGPVSLYHQHAATLAKRGNTTTAIDADECLRWLEGKEPRTVVYVSFGSIVHADPKQTVELGFGLEASGHPFVWVLKNPDQYGEDVREFLRDLEERVAGRGMLIRGWSPQVLILNHVAVGGFVTHCGWNSTLEAITAGLPVVTWPHFSDQFLNEKLAVEGLGIGVSIGIKEPLLRVGQKGGGVGREVVEAAVRSIMDGGGEGEERRRKALVLSEKARAAVQEGGSSLGNLLDLIKHFEVDTGGCMID
uniref:Glycosyltransferase n=1 Tax=Aegilops tauschii TaxID=37682 RepID=M8BCD1_AEGTA